MAGPETFHSHTAGPAQLRAADSIVSGIASLVESTPYLSPGAAGLWCQHLGSREVLLVPGSFTRTGSQACKARLGPGPSLPGIVPAVGKPRLLGCLGHTLSPLLLMPQPWDQACRKYQRPWSATSASPPCAARSAREPSGVRACRPKHSQSQDGPSMWGN